MNRLTARIWRAAVLFTGWLRTTGGTERQRAPGEGKHQRTNQVCVDEHGQKIHRNASRVCCVQQSLRKDQETEKKRVGRGWFLVSVSVSPSLFLCVLLVVGMEGGLERLLVFPQPSSLCVERAVIVWLS